MKRKNVFCIALLLLTIVTGVLAAPVTIQAAEEESGEQTLSEMIAGEDEKAPSAEVGAEGMIPVYGSDIVDGTYPVEVESSSSMFRIVEAYLTVSDGKMSAVITLGGKGYLKLFMGTGQEAVAAKESDYALYAEDKNGAYTYEIPVEALDMELECTSFSKRKEKWYDHQILFKASSLPKEALLIPLPVYEQETVSLEDGEYQIEVVLTGGTGRASIQSPARMTVEKGMATAQIVWSSPNYDYMMVSGKKYLPVNTEGNSVFEIPVMAFDSQIPVTADTTAMGTPHEIEYALTFRLDSVKKDGAGIFIWIILLLVILAAAVICGAVIGKRKIWSAMVMLICLMLFSSCGFAKENGNSLKADKDISPELTYDSREELRYAKEFALDYYNDYTLISISDGSRFLVVPEGAEVPSQLDQDIVVINRPLDKVYLVASAVMDMFRALDEVSAVRLSGTDTDGWYIEEAKSAMEQGEILYAGKYSAPDYELILEQGCRLALENTMITHTPEVKEKLQSFGIPVLVDHSSYETHPMGRVEWIKLYGVLLGKEKEAFEIFRQQEEEMGEAVSSGKEEKTVAFFYITTSGSVNVRKSSDYVPKMIELAGGRYIFDDLGSDDTHSASITMQMEEFYAVAKEADYLIYNSSIGGEVENLDELFSKSSLLKDFKAVQEGAVFCTTKNLYQESMSIGRMIGDIHLMLEGEKEENMQYLYRLE